MNIDAKRWGSFIERLSLPKVGAFLETRPGLRAPLGLAIPLIVLIVILGAKNPVFLSLENQVNLWRQISIYVIVGVGMTFVIAGGGIDLSVGSTMALSACTAGIILKSLAVPFVVPLAITTALIAGILVGAINGIAVSIFRIPPLIVTLGTMTAVRGFTYLIMGDRYRRRFPESFSFLGQGHVGPIPVPFLIALALVIIGAIVLNRCKFGRYILGIGGNREAAKRSGIHVQRYEFLSYTLVGGLAGLGGIILAARLDMVQGLLAAGAELHVITVVILGGTYLFGGFATMLGTLLGALFLGMTENGLLIVRIPFYWQRIVVGSLLIIAVGVQLYRFRRRGVVGE